MIRPLSIEVRSQSISRWSMWASAVMVAGLALPATDAYASSTRVKLACANDYYAHCSKFSPDSPEVRDCMRAVGENLSKRCVNALVADGEVSDQEVAEHTPSKRDDD
jgi:hypothetical protein